MKFLEGTLIRHVNTKKPMLVVGYIGSCLLVTDPEVPEALPAIEVILQRDKDNWLSDADFETKEKRNLNKMDWDIDYKIRKISRYRV